MDGLHGYVFAHAFLLELLVRKVKESDPDFEDFARGVFDKHLGEYFAKVGKADPMEIEARKMFEAIISTRVGTSQLRPMEARKPLTWKRRLFSWLERG